MTRPELVIPVADLERGPKHVDFVLSEAWLSRVLEGTDATVVSPGSLSVTVSKNGADVLVRGNLTADLTMPCVVTLDPVPVPVRVPVLLMLSPRTGGAERPGRPGRRRGASEAGGAAPREEKKGKWEETPVLTEEEAGQDTYDGHEIVLDDFTREFLILELPMFPRRSDLPTDTPAANPPLPAGSQLGGQVPLDPRLSPLAELKSRLEKLKKE